MRSHVIEALSPSVAALDGIFEHPASAIIVTDHHSSCTNLGYLVRMVQFL